MLYETKRLFLFVYMLIERDMFGDASQKINNCF